ncbi:B3 domain-containing protein REM9-like isoform X1 [Salvia miltiorrhiza]|uniref:B3 domain-containing protein REM9-like isoform X1 n=1 Tax=Salvia miltiorrhiza TaxID=226208 RepID=UPI0025AC012A|nr:B3 domain-containing protein REM9-like isoform X1 [Salvia miltiorrhiza]
MPRSQYQRASFMMFCRGDFSSMLCIPTKFMTKFRQAVQHSVVLETEYSPTLWDVKIKNLNSDFYMTDGWSEFVTDNQLGERDFLTFRLMSESAFKVSIYRGDDCTKHLTSPMNSRRRVVDEDESGIRRGRRPCKRKGGAQFKEGNPLCFKICLKPYNKTRINLPQKFSKAANMKVKKQVRMEYVGNGRCGVSVAVDARPENYRVDLGKGWPEFRVANGLEPGDSCSFEFNPDEEVIYVKEV